MVQRGGMPGEPGGGVDENKRCRDGGGGPGVGPAHEQQQRCQKNASAHADETGREAHDRTRDEHERQRRRAQIIGLRRGQEQAQGGEREGEREQDFENVRRHVEPAADKRQRDRGKGKGPEQPPGEVPGAKKEDGADQRDGEIQRERGGLHHQRGDAGQRHHREVAGRAAVADRPVERGDHEKKRQKLEPIGRHASNIQGAAPEITNNRIPHPKHEIPGWYQRASPMRGGATESLRVR